jgi:hypothetical protein
MTPCSDDSDTEIVYEADDIQHLHQEPAFELTQSSVRSFASLPSTRRRRFLQRPDFDSSDSESAAHDENPFEQLQKQLLKKEKENNPVKESSSATAIQHTSMHNDCEPEEPNNDQPLPTSSPEDWPLCNDDWNDDRNEEPPRQKKHNKTKRQDDFPTMHTTRTHDIVKRELERSRKRLRKSQDFQRDIAVTQASIVTPSTQSTKAKNSIVGTRPQHWGVTATPLMKRMRTSTRLSDTFTPFSNRSSQLAKATRGPFSLKNDTKTPTSKRNETKSFTPANLGKLTSAAEELKENDQPWYHRTNNTPTTRNKITPKKAVGPLVQKLAKLRAAMNADIVRLQSKMSIQDPRKDKLYMDVQLLGDATPLLEHHVIVLGKIDEKLAWIVFDKLLSGPKRLRFYNPIPLKIAAPSSGENTITHVVICTQFHEIL